MVTMRTDKGSMVGADGADRSFVGLSTDTKPTGVPNGTTFLEMDTSELYMYDADNETWRAL